MKWKLFSSGKSSAKQNMEVDSRLLACLGDFKDPILHFYEWENDSATYGYFIKPEEHINLNHSIKLDIARRPTGGGIILHLYDLAFSVLVPASHPAYSLNTMQNYAFVNETVSMAINEFTKGREQLHLLPEDSRPLDGHCKHFCMAKPTKYDVMLNGRKVGGGAQRNTKNGFLHQGSINLALPQADYLNKVLLPGTCVLEAMQKNSSMLLSDNFSEIEFKDAKSHLQQLLIHAFKDKDINPSHS